MKNKKQDYEFYAQIGTIIVLLSILIFNVFGNAEIVSASSVIPIGVPPIYGKELGIKYDFVSASNPELADQTIALLGNIDRSEQLNEEQTQRYINILYYMNDGISCEYCCGARSVIFENGQPACGCAHSYAMRGITKYLIKYHGDEFTDEQILEEVGKWKVLFFPGILEQKAQIMNQQEIDVTYTTLTTNMYRNIERGQATGSMVGGC